jgi:TolB-like protein
MIVMRKLTHSFKENIYIIIVFMLVLYSQTAAANGTPRIQTDKDVYTVGEEIQVNYFNAPGEKRDWICIVPAGSPDNEGGDYDYMPKDKSQGVMKFQPPAPGKYEARAYYNYSHNGYIVSARYPFSVVVSGTPAPPPPAAPVVEKSTQDDKPQVKDSPVRIDVSVFYFTPRTMDTAKYSMTVTETIINTPAIRSSFTVLGRRDLEIFLSANNLQQNDRIENIIDIGTRLGLNFIIAGSVEKQGTLIFTNCKVVNIVKRDIIFQKQFVSMGEADLVNNVVKLCNPIIEAIFRNAN